MGGMFGTEPVAMHHVRAVTEKAGEPSRGVISTVFLSRKAPWPRNICQRPSSS